MCRLTGVQVRRQQAAAACSCYHSLSDARSLRFVRRDGILHGILAHARTLHPSAIREGRWSAHRGGPGRQGNPHGRRPAPLSSFSLRRPAEPARHLGTARRRDGHRGRRGAQLRTLSHAQHAHLPAHRRPRARPPALPLVQRDLPAGQIQARPDDRALRQGRGRSAQPRTADHSAAVRDSRRPCRFRRKRRGEESGGVAGNRPHRPHLRSDRAAYSALVSAHHPHRARQSDSRPAGADSGGGARAPGSDFAARRAVERALARARRESYRTCSRHALRRTSA